MVEGPSSSGERPRKSQVFDWETGVSRLRTDRSPGSQGPRFARLPAALRPQWRRGDSTCLPLRGQRRPLTGFPSIRAPGHDTRGRRTSLEM